MDETFSIRPIRSGDNAAVAALIREVMPQFGCSGPGFAINDPEVDDMHAAYAGERSAFFVVEKDGRVVGAAGIAALAGGEEDVCELRKMYFLPEARGQGLGQKMMELCLRAAALRGFRRCYLETMGSMEKARALYERNGFKRLDKAMGATGHFSCNAWYLKDLER